jgi:hypothetical protein
MEKLKSYSDKIHRKEVSLSNGVVQVLAKLANRERRPLKNYMESVLIDHAMEKAETNGTLKKAKQ